MKHYMKLQPGSFEKIRGGQKIIENRLNDEKRQLIKVGDIIEFTKEPDLLERIEVTVVGLYKYPSFREMFDELPHLYPDKNDSTTEAWVNGIRKYYSEEDEQRYGVLGIRLQVV